MKKHILALTLLVSTSPLMAATVSVNFDAFPATAFTAGTESGFTITADVGSNLSTDAAFLGPFNGSNSLHHNSATQSGITLSNGGVFSFSSLQAGASFGGAPAGSLILTGSLGGVSQAVDTYSPVNNVYTLFSAVNLAGISIDALHIDMGAAGPGPTHIDNIILNATGGSAVPVPPSVWLLGAGMLGLLGLRRRRV